MIVFRACFVVIGSGLLGFELALLANFRGFGTSSEDGLSAWLGNPAAGRVWTRFASLAGMALSVGLILAGLFAK